MSTSTIFIALAGLAASVSANIYTTQPITGMSCNGGQPCLIRWEDSTTTPSAADFGPTLVDLWAGTDTNQTFVYNLATIANPAQTLTTTAIIPPTVCPTGQYFIRYTSLNVRDAAGIPLLAFSPRFTLAGMTGATVPQATANPAILSASVLSTYGAASAAASTPTSLPVASQSNVVLAVSGSVSASASKKSGAAQVALARGVAALAVVAAGVAVML